MRDHRRGSSCLTLSSAAALILAGCLDGAMTVQCEAGECEGDTFPGRGDDASHVNAAGSGSAADAGCGDTACTQACSSSAQCGSGQLCLEGECRSECPAPGAGSAGHGLVIHTSLALDKTSVAAGQTITGKLTYRNIGGAPVVIQSIVIAGRPPGGTHAGGPWLDFSPKGAPTTVQPCGTVTLTASRTILPTDPVGDWISFPTWQDGQGLYHDGPDTPFKVTGPAMTPTMRVVGRHLYDACGQQVVLRGVNDMNIWLDPQGNRLPEIAKTGANSVRIVWCGGKGGACGGTRGSPAQLDALLQRAIDNGLLPMIELHDATGNLWLVPSLVDYWVEPAVVAVLQKHERTLLVNIANEAGDANSDNDFVSVYTSAIQRMRAAGIRALLFSAHIYCSWDGTPQTRAQRVQAEFAESVSLGMPLVIGEFAGTNPNCSVAPPWEAILTEAQVHSIGWLAWSWSPGNSCSGLDMSSSGAFAGIKAGWPAAVSTTHAGSIAKTSKPIPSLAGVCP